MIDELDILQKEMENKDYAQRTQMMAREAELDNMPPEFKAKQLGHMRQFVEN